jgi:hypothetical protein
MELATIMHAARSYTGWTATDGDRRDREQAYRIAAELTTDPRDTAAMNAWLRNQADRLVAVSGFKTRASRVANALLERGKLTEGEIACVLADAERYCTGPRRFSINP